MANDACRTGVIILGPPIPWACKHRVQFTANKRLDQLANPFAYTDLDWIKPVFEKVGGGVRCRLEGIRLRGNVCHGVVSVPALQRRMIRGSTRRLRQPNSHHFRYGTFQPRARSPAANTGIGVLCLSTRPPPSVPPDLAREWTNFPAEAN